MPSFDIADGPTQVELSPGFDGWSGSSVFSITNHTSGKVNARLSVRATGSAAVDWMKIYGEILRTMNFGETIAVTVGIQVPGQTPPSRAGLVLRVVNENDSSNDWADSGERSFTVPFHEAATPPKSSPPPAAHRSPLLAIAAVVLVLVAALALWAGFRHRGSKTTDDVTPAPVATSPTPTPSASVSPKSTATPCHDRPNQRFRCAALKRSDDVRLNQFITH